MLYAYSRHKDNGHASYMQYAVRIYPGSFDEVDDEHRGLRSDATA